MGESVINGIIIPTKEIEMTPSPQGFVAKDNLYIPPIKAPPENVILPTGTEVDEYVIKPNKIEKQTIYTQEQLHYLASPLDFFHLRLEEFDIPSPIPEIQSKIKDSIDMVALEYNQLNNLEKQTGEIPKDYYKFLTNSVDFILNFTKDQAEIDKFFTYLNMLNETQIYSNRAYKLDDQPGFEKILENLVENKIEISDEICNFFSYFQIPDNTKSVLLENIPKSSHHALRDYVKSYFEKEYEGQKFENIGIEIEGTPLIFIGQNSHPGFKMGIDGAEDLSELRRITKEIKFDKKFKGDLFELWYWAKMSHYVGSSVHIHIDNNEKNYNIDEHNTLKKYQAIFGEEEDDIRTNCPSGDQETVEVRLNLPYYNYPNLDDAKKELLIQKSDTDIYNLTGLIESLISIKTGTGDQSLLGKDLHPFWAKRFESKSKIITDKEEAYARITGSNNLDERLAVLNNMSEEILIDIIHPLTEYFRTSSQTLINMYRKLPPETLGNIAFDLIETSQEDPLVIKKVMQALEPTTLEKMLPDFIEKYKSHKTEIIIQAIRELPGSCVENLSDDILEMSRYKKGMFSKTYYPQDVLELLLVNLNEEALATKAIDLFTKLKENTEHPRINLDTFKYVIRHLSKDHLDEIFNDIVKLSDNNPEVIVRIIERISEEKLINSYSDLQKANNRFVVIEQLACYLPKEILDQKYKDFLLESRNNISVLEAIIKNLPQATLALEARNFLDISKKSDIVISLIENLPEYALTEMAYDLLRVSTGSGSHCMEELINRLPSKTVATMTNDFIKSSKLAYGYSDLIINTIVTKLPKNKLPLFVDNLIKNSMDSNSIMCSIVNYLPTKTLVKNYNHYIDISKNNENVIVAVIKKLPENILINQFSDLMARSYDNVEVINAVAASLPNRILQDIASDLINLSKNDPDVIETISKSMPIDMNKLTNKDLSNLDLPEEIVIYDQNWGSVTNWG